MKKYLALSLFFLFTAVSAEQVTDEQLKTSGRALANYQLCSNVADKRNDQAMFNYYSEMYSDSLQASKMFYIWQVQVIIDLQQETAMKLAAINKNSFAQLCISRFDDLSRKMQEQKIRKKTKENAIII